VNYACRAIKGLPAKLHVGKTIQHECFEFFLPIQALKMGSEQAVLSSDGASHSVTSGKKYVRHVACDVSIRACQDDEFSFNQTLSHGSGFSGLSISIMQPS